MIRMLRFLRKITPKFVLQGYHYFLAKLAPWFYGHPSKKLLVIGVTGTTGKSSTVNIMAKILEGSGLKVGFTTTANFKVGSKEWTNDKKMTMLGRFQTQRLLSEMVKGGCQIAIIETTSQGVSQFRHLGIHYDYLVFTNLFPEHIQAHGSFLNYRAAKGKLFEFLGTLPHKTLNGRKIDKKIFVNIDDEHADYFLQFKADFKIGYTLNSKFDAQLDRIYNVTNLLFNSQGATFDFEGTHFVSNLLGRFNVYNLAAALSVAFEEKLPIEKIKKSLLNITGIPGRLEKIDEGQDFLVIVDYAFEPRAMASLYETIDLFDHNRIIHVLGGTGGGRDVSHHLDNGRLVGEKADIVIVTNEDPYDDDPREIMERVAQGAKDQGKVLGSDLFIIEDRKKAIFEAVKMAKPGDVVLITGKGNEPVMVVKGKKIPHDDRLEVKKALKEVLNEQK